MRRGRIPPLDLHVTTPGSASPALPPETAARFAEFARSCKAAARAVALYPGSHPAIGVSLDRLTQATSRLDDPVRLQVRADTLLLDGALALKPDVAIAELAEVLHRHLIGALTIHAGADAGSWRALLLLLARPPEEVRAEGGVAHLWTATGAPTLAIVEVDYAEVLREKQGLATTIDEILAAALEGPQLELDDAAALALAEILADPAKLDALMAQLDAQAAGGGEDVKAAAFLSLLRGLAEYLARTGPEKLETMFKQMGHAAGRLSAEEMVALLSKGKGPDAMAGTIDVVSAMADRMSDSSVAQFVAGSIIAEKGPTDRLAEAFQALVPEQDRQRQLLALAQPEVSASEVAEEQAFPELWDRVEGMLTSYSDESFVSSAYGRELAGARSRAVMVEAISDDSPERIAAWLATVDDSALRGLDHRLLLDLLVIETDALRWRDIAQTVVAHADDLVRVGSFDEAWQLVETVIGQGTSHIEREPHARGALERFGGGSLMKHVTPHLRSVPDEGYERFKLLCHAIGTAVVAPLAEVLATEQDARSRRRLRDVLVGFGARGRESVQQLMTAPNWEVRRTAAYLLREFGGTEGLKELVPLLTDAEPLVRREAIQALAFSGTEEASGLLLTALKTTTGQDRERLAHDLMATRDRRAVPIFSFLVRQLDPVSMPDIYTAAIEALGATGAGGGVEAVEALRAAFRHGQWWAPVRTKRQRATIAAALRKIGTPEAMDALRSAAASGPRGVRAAARAQLPGRG
ncbi:MAG: HEAT repeat domain-containing protein [Acidobacteriota bacterium]|nr:HEAT repeat domain-containing protein [Acidobacteriota bacterium]